MPRKGPTPYHMLDYVSMPWKKQRVARSRNAYIRASYEAYKKRKSAKSASPQLPKQPTPTPDQPPTS